MNKRQYRRFMLKSAKQIERDARRGFSSGGITLGAYLKKLDYAHAIVRELRDWEDQQRKAKGSFTKAFFQFFSRIFEE